MDYELMDRQFTFDKQVSIHRENINPVRFDELRERYPGPATLFFYACKFVGDFSNKKISYVNFDSCIFESVSISKAYFLVCCFSGCSLISVRLKGALFIDTELDNCIIYRCNFSRATFNRSTLDFVKISESNFSFSKLINDSSLTSCQVNASDFRFTEVDCCDIRCTIFIKTSIENAKITGSDMRGANINSKGNFTKNVCIRKCREDRKGLNFMIKQHVIEVVNIIVSVVHIVLNIFK